MWTLGKTELALNEKNLFAYYAFEDDKKCETPEEVRSLNDSDDDLQLSSTKTLVKNVVKTCIEEEALHSQEFEDYRYQLGTYPQYSIYTQALEMARDQLGCRVIQKKLEEHNPFTFQTISEQILPEIISLMTHPFGNYLAQKFFEVSDYSSLSTIVEQTNTHLYQISLDTHGTRAVQKLIEVISQHPELVPKLILSLKSQVVSLIKDPNGNHVVQKCLNSFSPQFNEFIYRGACEKLVEIAKHRHGCCVLQRCIDAASPSQMHSLVNNIVEHSVELVQDAFANYVVQYVLDLELPEVNERLAGMFMDNMKLLAKQKFSSNVIEKCLELSQVGVRTKMIQVIAEKDNIAEMIKDQYGNYVVQRALMLADKESKSTMLTEIKGVLSHLKNTQFGKRIYAKLVKFYPQLLESVFR